MRDGGGVDDDHPFPNGGVAVFGVENSFPGCDEKDFGKRMHMLVSLLRLRVFNAFIEPQIIAFDVF